MLGYRDVEIERCKDVELERCKDAKHSEVPRIGIGRGNERCVVMSRILSPPKYAEMC